MLGNNHKLLVVCGVFIVLHQSLIAQTPVVENVHFEQRTDGSLLVDIYYDVTSVGDLPLEIFVEASANHAVTWDLPCFSLSGDVGKGVLEGTGKHVVWDFYSDNPDTSGYDYQVRVTGHCMVCGQTLTESLTLTRDLACSTDLSPVITIGAPDMTLDLGGHIISGDIANGSQECIIIDHVDGTSIRNGTIEGFIGGIIVDSSDSTTIENLIIKDLEIDDPFFYMAAIIPNRSRDVRIRDCRFEYLPVFHKGAISSGNSELHVDHIEVVGGGTGVDFGGNMEPGLKPSRGTVTNSTFDGITIAGILTHYADSVVIEDNVFKNGAGIYTDPGWLGGVRRLFIRSNEISGSNIGVLFHGTIESVITGNIITDNIAKGIALLPNVDCGLPDITCFYSTQNIVSNNVLSGNGTDLFHDQKCTGNTWENNEYETAEGDEIFSSPPVTAQEAFTHIDSTASEMAGDNQLLNVSSLRCDSLGRSNKWIFIYESTSQEKRYEIWYQDGRTQARDSLSNPVDEGLLPITASWIDSDSALVVADGMGGMEFRESNEISNIEMSLQNTWALLWTINMFAQDTTFQVYFEASEK